MNGKEVIEYFKTRINGTIKYHTFSFGRGLTMPIAPGYTNNDFQIYFEENFTEFCVYVNGEGKDFAIIPNETLTEQKLDEIMSQILNIRDAYSDLEQIIKK